MTDATTPDDYDRTDGYDERQGLDKCPHCERVFSANGGLTGPCYEPDGTRYDSILDSDPNDGPFFCADCWTELDANRKRVEHATLGEWSG